ncbi:SPFH domain-containing protein [Marinifilum sp. D714]|uniref:SPFH domain-containing protein n=1 Tax=Marinifilum sp. D714 TaxID=2937523 RepID=UPI0027C37E2F|nr:SPFH domain-containing protein [Marinifilum sp. D714]MDQ2180237.1 SPFH domain-containing protein [Marinifilum sp. D714]
MKKKYLIGFLLILSFYCKGNDLTMVSKLLTTSTYSPSVLMNDRIFYQEVRGDSIPSVTKNGVKFFYSFAIRYYTSDNNFISTLQNGGSKNYIHPDITAVMDGVFKQYKIEEIYSFKRQEVEDLLLKMLREKFEKNNIKIDALLIRSIDFSEVLKQQIYERLVKEEEERKARM